ncbi:MAG: hypothetical protein JSV99_00740 [Planctomycetota bacterium]|nr:MAG: hypothetical protein JSV99_00740 [Planctomycetota bacterium]
MNGERERFACGGLINHPNSSPADYYDNEPQCQRCVNFKYYNYLASNRLK